MSTQLNKVIIMNTWSGSLSASTDLYSQLHNHNCTKQPFSTFNNKCMCVPLTRITSLRGNLSKPLSLDNWSNGCIPGQYSKHATKQEMLFVCLFVCHSNCLIETYVCNFYSIVWAFADEHNFFLLLQSIFLVKKQWLFRKGSKGIHFNLLHLHVPK